MILLFTIVIQLEVQEISAETVDEDGYGGVSCHVMLAPVTTRRWSKIKTLDVQ